MSRITVLGNFSGRNAGDNAILGNLLEDISRLYPDTEFVVPTLNANYVRRAFSEYRVKPLGLMPWNGAAKIFGLPTLRAMLQTDLVLITDNILFDRAYFNPGFNYLSTIALIAPLCRLRDIPVVLYNASVGPIRTRRGARALQRVLDAGPVAILRDQGSRELIQDLQLRSPEILMGADCALNTRIVDSDRVDEILRSVGVEAPHGPLFGFNVNAYINTWQRSNGDTLDRPRFVSLIAEAIDNVVDRLDVQPLCFISQVMDRRIQGEVIERMKCRARVRTVANPQFSYQEIASVMSRLELLVGMRTHCLILATAVGTPIVNINAYPKSLAYLRTLEMDSWSIPVEDLSAISLTELIMRAWDAREETRRTLRHAVVREQELARQSARVVGRLLELEESTRSATAS
jgi:polysaccharide pyruvyl transferase WcaK-like protein